MKCAVRMPIVALLMLILTTRQSSFCSDDETGLKEKNYKKIYAVNYPLQYFAERISGNRISVVFPGPQDVDPAYWSPDIKLINQFQSADLILLNGATYAKWISWVSLPISKSVNTSTHFKSQWIKMKEGLSHSHGKNGEHNHHGFASTTWLNPIFAIYQAEEIKKAFIKLLPEYSTEFLSNYTSLRKEMLDLDKAIRRITEDKRTLPVLASHPVYQYLEHRYGLNVHSVHWEPDVMPEENEWNKLKEILRGHPAKWMIWEDTPNLAIEEELLKLDIRSTVFNPCGNKPKHGDFMQTMWKNVKGLEKIWEET